MKKTKKSRTEEITMKLSEKTIDTAAKYALIFIIWCAFIFTAIAKYSYSEVDSYVLPSISLQYRQSLIITQEDIDRAKIDFPELYRDVETYNDLRASKLVKLDDDHWMSFYFPVYAILSMPVKLLFQIVSIPQEKCFLISTVLIFSIALIAVYKYAQKNGVYNNLIILFLIVSPIWIYFLYMSGEGMMAGLVTLAMVCWKTDRYKLAALIISITSMMNPTVMGIGILLFIDYFIKEFMEDHKFFLKKEGFIKTLKLCLCYVPSLIPFIINKIYLGKWNPTINRGAVVGDSWTKRFLAYIFDLNLGIASFALITVFLFLAALIYSVIKKNRRMLLECIAALFTIWLFASHKHINCGMRYCARYVIWVYPVVVFAVCDFLDHAFANKRKLQVIISAFSLMMSAVVIAFNGINYHSLQFSNVSKLILDNHPNLYVSFCESTFNSRTDHMDGAYYLEKKKGYTIYHDSKTGEVRKVLYINNADVKKRISAILDPNDGTDFSSLFKTEDDGKHYYINIPRSSKTQFTEDPVKTLVTDIFAENECEYDRELTEKIALGVYKFDPEAIEYLYDCIDEDLPAKDIIHKYYTQIFGRNESPDESTVWCNYIRSGKMDKHDIFVKLFKKKDFKIKYGIYYNNDPEMTKTEEYKLYIESWSQWNNVILTPEETEKYAEGLTEQSRETVDIIYSWFMNDDEFANYTDEEYIGFLYNTLLRRYPDQRGLNSWCKQLENNVTREEAFYSFLFKDEFQNDLISADTETSVRS
ncbi:MAG: DUF4214 domain-containing protein [Huintestinicola sp.]|uniref:DUF4214 domain-containing protein n=1 Tax=Huintestinicola sp. TaxID=2981661 RepID=UPI003F041F73